MKTTSIFILFYSLLCFAGYSQTINSNDYKNQQFVKSKRDQATIFLNLLGKGQIKDAIKLIDPIYLKNQKNYADTLTAYGEELKLWFESSELAIIVEPYKDGKICSHCIYLNNKKTVYDISLFYKSSNSNEFIFKIVKMSKAEIEHQRETEQGIEFSR